MTNQSISLKSIEAIQSAQSKAIPCLYALRSMFLSGVSTYLHQSLVIEGKCYRLSDLFSDMAGEAIANYHAMGECITILGGNPVPIVQSKGEISMPDEQTPEEMLRTNIEVCRNVTALLRQTAKLVTQSRVLQLIHDACVVQEQHEQSMFAVYGQCFNETFCIT